MSEILRKMRKLCTLMALLWAYFNVNAQVGFQVSPGKLFFRQSVGQVGSQTVRITNSSPNDLVLECNFADWKRDSMATKIYAAPGTYPGSISKYLKVTPENISLKPGESKLVEVNLSLPAEDDHMVSNAMLFITQVNEKELANRSNNKQTSMVFRVQMGVHVYNETPQLQSRNIDIEDVQYIASNPVDGGKKDSSSTQKKISALIANIGERITEGTVRFELTHKETLDEWKSKPLDFNSMPGDKFYVSNSLPGSLAKGRYALVTIVDFGSDQPLKVAESEIEIK